MLQLAGSYKSIVCAGIGVGIGLVGFGLVKNRLRVAQLQAKIEERRRQREETENALQKVLDSVSEEEQEKWTEILQIDFADLIGSDLLTVLTT